MIAEALFSDLLRDWPWFPVAFFFVIGSFVGSFLNVVVYRLPRNCLSVNNPKRSFCPSCKTQLGIRDNVPIAGWVMLRGKCRYCGAKFSVRYALVELLTAVLFAFATWRVLYGDGANTDSIHTWLMLLHVLVMIGVLIPWALIDLDMQVIPDRLTFVPLLAFIPLSANAYSYRAGISNAQSGPRLGQPEFDPLLFGFMPEWLNSMASAMLTGLAGMAFLWLAGRLGNMLFRKQAQKIGGDSMGWADVKIMLLLGVMLGWPKMLAGFFIAILLGSIVGSIARLARGSLGVPFGPFLAVGALAAMLFAPEIDTVVRGYFEWLGALMQ